MKSYQPGPPRRTRGQRSGEVRGGGGGGTLEAFARDPNVKMLLEGAAACRNVGERRGRGGGGGSKTVTGVNLNAFDNHAVIL